MRNLLVILLVLSSVSLALAEEVKVPSLRLLYRLSLEDVSFYVRAGHQPDAFLTFSPDEKFLAVGTFLGRLLLLKAQTGEILWEKRIPEGMVKKIAFSPDGRTIYYGEQSPDGFIYAADRDTGKIKWRFRLADDLLPGEPPEKGDVYGIYRQPGCYRLKVLVNGDLLVLGLHSWYDRRQEVWRRLSRLYRLTPEGKLVWAWPKEGPAKLTLIFADADRSGRVVATVALSPSEDMPKDYPFSPNTLYILDGNGQERWRYQIPPLKPYYDRVSVWESVRVSPEGHYALVGTADGRAFIVDLMKKRVRIIALGAPIKIGGFPVAAMINYGYALKDTFYFLTGTSSLPYSLPMAIDRPAGPHPQANTLFALGPYGQIKWRFTADFRLQGIEADREGRIVAVAVGGSRRSLRKTRQFGVFVFDTRRPGGGLEKLVGYFPTEGPCFFHLAVSPQGHLVALVETPYLTEEERLVGRYQILVLKLLER